MGELIDLSGMMSGGGAKPRGGGMNLKLTANVAMPDILWKYA